MESIVEIFVVVLIMILLFGIYGAIKLSGKDKLGR